MSGEKAFTVDCKAYKGWKDVRLFLTALRLGRVAQGVRHHPIATILPLLQAKSPKTPTHTMEAAICAMLRANRRLTLLPGHLDSCLTRCLVAATLMRHLGETRIHIGFREDVKNIGAHEGHAWLSLDGRIVYDGGEGVDGHEYVEVRSLSVP